MKYHPVQTRRDLLEVVENAFKSVLEKKKLLPTNPYKAKKTQAWLELFGCRMIPHRANQTVFVEKDYKKFIYFDLICRRPKLNIKGSRLPHRMLIECPWELADKIILFGFLPEAGMA